MKKLPTNQKENNVQTHIANGWKLIDEYLPATYVQQVIELDPSLKGSEFKIRNVRRKLQKAHRHMKIFTALVKVAKANKDAVEFLSQV